MEQNLIFIVYVIILQQYFFIVQYDLFLCILVIYSRTHDDEPKRRPQEGYPLIRLTMSCEFW